MSEHQSNIRVSGSAPVETTTGQRVDASGSARASSGQQPGQHSGQRLGTADAGATPVGATDGAGRTTGRRRGDRIVAASAAMQEVSNQASGIARSDEVVTIAGASGVGRRHVARAIHQWSPRAGAPLVELQLAGLSEPAQTRELFGDGTAPGGLSQAQGGSLLLESADQLSPGTLTRLVEAMRAASGSATRTRLLLTVGDTESGSDGRDASASTSAALSTLSALGGERIRIAPLADRTEDILPLAAHFLAEFAAEESIEPVGFTADARRWLIEEPWTGNVRELRERIRQAIGLAGQAAISAEALMLSTEGEEVPSFKDAKRAFETRYVEGLLRRCSGNISRAARMAKKDRKDFYDVIRRTGVDPGQFRG